MTAADHLSPQQFFHGTAAQLQPGDLIEPGHPHNFGHLADSPHVYFTPHAEAARDYAMIASDLDAEREHTYHVEPAGEHEPDPEAMGNYVSRSLIGSRRSTSPLRVVREVQR